MHTALFIVIALALLILFIYGIWHNTAAAKGQAGENWIHNILMQLPDEYVVFKDVILKTPKGTTQIDHIVVSFCGEAVLTNVESSIPVVYDNNLLDLIRSYTTSYLTEQEVHDVVVRLDVCDYRELIDDRTHVQNIRAKVSEENHKIASGICPKCGGTLVLRHGKYGSFYGCSNYPKCRYILK